MFHGFGSDVDVVDASSITDLNSEIREDELGSVGDEIMLLDGPPTGIEGLMFGETIDFAGLAAVVKKAAAKTATAKKVAVAKCTGGQVLVNGRCQCPPGKAWNGRACAALPAVKKPAAKPAPNKVVAVARNQRKVTTKAIAVTKQKVQKLVTSRTKAVTVASAARKRAETKATAAGQAAIKVASQAAVAAKTNQPAKARQLISKANQLVKIQSKAAQDVERFTKAQAVASVLVKNAKAQEDLMTVAQTQAAQGAPPQQIAVTINAAQQIEDQSKEMKDVRERQINVWEQQDQEEKESEIPDVAAGDQEAGMESEETPDTSMSEEESQDYQTGADEGEAWTGDSDDGSDSGSDSTPDDSENMDGLEFSFSDITKAVSGVVKKVTNTVKKTVNTVKKAASSAASLVKKGACAVVNNPAVTSVVAGAATGGAGAVAAQAASRLTQATGFCSKPAAKPAVKPIVRTQATVKVAAKLPTTIKKATTITLPKTATTKETFYPSSDASKPAGEGSGLRTAGMIVVPAAVAAALFFL